MTAQEEQDQYERATDAYYSRLARTRRQEQGQDESQSMNYPGSASGRLSPYSGRRPLSEVVSELGGS